MTDNYLKSRLDLFFVLSLFPHQNLDAVRFVLFIQSLILWEQNCLTVFLQDRVLLRLRVVPVDSYGSSQLS